MATIEDRAAEAERILADDRDYLIHSWSQTGEPMVPPWTPSFTPLIVDRLVGSRRAKPGFARHRELRVELRRVA